MLLAGGIGRQMERIWCILKSTSVTRKYFHFWLFLLLFDHFIIENYITVQSIPLVDAMQLIRSVGIDFQKK